MPSITSTNVAQAIVKLIALQGVAPLMSNLVMGKLVNRNYEPLLANAGDTVNVPLPPSMTANNIAEGGSVSLQNPNLGNAQVQLTNHVEASFVIPDVTNVLVGTQNGKFPLLDKYMQPAIIAVAEKIESDLLNLYANFSVNAPVGAAGTSLVESVVDAAESALFAAKVPESLPKYLIVNQDGYSALRQIERFTETRMIGSGAAIQTGKVGDVKGFQVFRSQLVPKTGSSPVNVHNLAFASDAIMLVTRRLPQPLPGTGAIAEYVDLGEFGLRVVMSYNPNTLSQQFTVDVLYGTAPLRTNFAVQVNS